MIGLNQIIQTLTIIFLSSLALKNPKDFGNVIYVIVVLPYFSGAIRTLNFMNIGLADKNAADDFITTLLKESAPSGKLDAPKDV